MKAQIPIVNQLNYTYDQNSETEIGIDSTENSINKQAISIYTYQKNIYVRFANKSNIDAKLYVYASSGKEIVSKTLTSNLNKVSLNVLADYYLVKVHFNNCNYTERIILK